MLSMTNLAGTEIEVWHIDYMTDKKTKASYTCYARSISNDMASLQKGTLVIKGWQLHAFSP